jgi:8-hydroxy-5-deazaflavin:NADPH oxidoreductase
MKIGIIGSGVMAQALIRALIRADHEVMIGSTSVARASQVAATLTRPPRAGSYREAAEFGEIVIFATDWVRVAAVAEALKNISGKPLLDCSNPEVIDGIGLVVGTNTSGAEELAKALPQFQVVKTLNHVYAESLDALATPGTAVPRIFYCGDSQPANACAAALLTSLGIVPVFAGPLVSARYLEPLSQLLVYFVRVEKLDPASTLVTLSSQS